ncbi:MAG: GHKL domain-containing protein [Clostridia bacterium]|nr:GHKL domain-containing protein [Clostridia bacterium]
MFKKSRRKIVATIMSILVVLWVGTLSIIYASSYIEMSRQNRQMLTIHAEMYNLESENDIPPNKPFLNGKNPNFNSNFSNSPMFQLTTFYTVALTYDGETIEIQNDRPGVHTNEELSKLALNIVEAEKDSGTKNNLSYYATDKDGYILVAFMDNTIVNENATTLFRYTLIFGGVALIIFFFFSTLLARKIVQPLEDSYKKQKQFISDAGHELKTPVSVVSASAELLSREIGENQWLENIQYENERMGMLVGQLLDLARTENTTPQMEQIDFSRLCTGEVVPFESVAFEKGLTINCNIIQGVIVEGNNAQLKQLVSILLDNAISHSNGSGEISLSLTTDRGYAKLSVINKGETIPTEHRTRIFERFYRTDAARNGEDKHYGLGLSIAKAIITAHKGQIDVLCYNGLVEFQIKLPIQ